MDWKKWFEMYGKQKITFAHIEYGDSPYPEDMYQAFKARLIDELAVSAPRPGFGMIEKSLEIFDVKERNIKLQREGLENVDNKTTRP